MKIKTNNVPADCDYLTNGKEYECFHNYIYPRIIDDVGDELTIRISRCLHLNGAPWEIVSE